MQKWYSIYLWHWTPMGAKSPAKYTVCSTNHPDKQQREHQALLAWCGESTGVCLAFLWLNHYNRRFKDYGIIQNWNNVLSKAHYHWAFFAKYTDDITFLHGAITAHIKKLTFPLRAISFANLVSLTWIWHAYRTNATMYYAVYPVNIHNKDVALFCNVIFYRM